jgi:hypothetical protein
MRLSLLCASQRLVLLRSSQGEFRVRGTQIEAIQAEREANRLWAVARR